MTAPFIIRLLDFANDQIFPSRLAAAILNVNPSTAKTPRVVKWVDALRGQDSIMSTWDKEYFVPRIVERLPAAKAKFGQRYQ
jgi:hypothetical protein